MRHHEAEVLLKKHLEAWNETDPGKRSAIIEEIYTDDVEFIDPFTVATGQVSLNNFIGELQSKNTGFVFSLNGNISSHHTIAKLFWHFGPPAKPDTITGQDIFVIKDGRIKKLYAFIDGLPAV